jgi:hypothetical protein
VENAGPRDGRWKKHSNSSAHAPTPICSAILIKGNLPNFGGKVVKAKQDAPLRRPGTTLSRFFVEKREQRRRNLFSFTKAPERLNDLSAGE